MSDFTASKDYRLRPNNHDPQHALQLLRDLALINERTVRELGPLPPGGLPVQPKRKPQLPPPPESLAFKEDEMNPLQRMAATTVLATGALAACSNPAHPSEPSPAAPPASAAATAPMLSYPAPAPVATVEPVADAARAEIKRGPAIPAAVLRQQVLVLLDSLQSLERLEREHVESIFKVRMTQDPEMRDGYEYFGITTEGWTYRIAVMRLHALSDPSTVKIALNNGVQPWAEQKPTYCTMDFEELAQDIVALGYERGATRSNFGNKPSWGFGRDVLARHAGFGVGVYLYYLDEGTDSERACVKSFRISGGPRHG